MQGSLGSVLQHIDTLILESTKKIQDEKDCGTGSWNTYLVILQSLSHILYPDSTGFAFYFLCIFFLLLKQVASKKINLLTNSTYSSTVVKNCAKYIT